MLSTVLPYAAECAPHELLPIIPPMVHRSFVDGSGAKNRPCGASALLRWLWTTPGSTCTVRAPASIASTRFMYFEKSSTRAALHAWPARLGPAARARIG